MATEVVIPMLGVTVERGTILQWCKKVGERVAKGEILFIVQTEKVTTEVESPADGFLAAILLPEGREVPVLTRVGWITAEGEAVPADEASSAAVPPAGVPTASSAAASAAPSVPAPAAPLPAGPVRAVPAARFLAAREGVDLAGVAGTGPGGVVRHADVEKALTGRRGQVSGLAARQAAASGVDASGVAGGGVRGRVMLADVQAAAASAGAPGLGRVLPMSMQRMVIARRLSESKQSAPHVYFFADVAMDPLLALRKGVASEFERVHGLVPSVNDYLIKAVALTIEEFPLFNASLVGNEIHVHPDIFVGLAVAVPDGLLVPSVPNPQLLGLVDIARQRAGLVARARTGALSPDEMTRGTFTITSLAQTGVVEFAAIINPPQVAILSVPASQTRVVLENGAPAERRFCRFGLSVDHRVLDGAVAADFLGALARRLENPAFTFLGR